MKIDELVSQMLRARAMSLGELTQRLHYSSKTSIARVLKGNAGRRAVVEFFERMRSEMDLSARELRELEHALACGFWQRNQSALQEMLCFLRGEIHSEEELLLETENGRQCSFLDRYGSLHGLRITLLNSQFVPVFESLRTLLQDCGAQVEHFIMVDADTVRTIRAVSVAMLVFAQSGYSGFTHRPLKTAQGTGHMALLAADLMIVRHGNGAEDLIVFDRESHGCVRSGREGMFSGLIEIPRERYAPLKRSYFECTALEDYAKYSRDYARLEYNRTVYKIKPDMGVDWIPADILLAAVQEGPFAADPQLREVVEPLLPVLEEIYRLRVQNTYEKRKHAYAIMKRGALRRFVRTGRTTDHFWGMRHYTLAERVRILRLLLEQMEQNPCFHVHFLKDNSLLRDVEISYYEGEGMLILDSETDYNLAEGHAEMLIQHREFLRLFKEYYMDELLRTQVISDGEARAFLREMIELCEAGDGER